jgi:hypothetical protein
MRAIRNFKTRRIAGPFLSEIQEKWRDTVFLLTKQLEGEKIGIGIGIYAQSIPGVTPVSSRLTHLHFDATLPTNTPRVKSLKAGKF